MARNVVVDWRQMAGSCCSHSTRQPRTRGRACTPPKPQGPGVSLRKGEEIGTLEQVDDIPAQDMVVSGVEMGQLTMEKRQMLWEMTTRHATQLSKSEEDKLFQLLLDYKDVFATSNSDVGDEHNKLQIAARFLLQETYFPSSLKVSLSLTYDSGQSDSQPLR